MMMLSFKQHAVDIATLKRDKNTVGKQLGVMFALA
jgi:hypothetical protein